PAAARARGPARAGGAARARRAARPGGAARAWPVAAGPARARAAAAAGAAARGRATAAAGPGAAAAACAAAAGAAADPRGALAAARASPRTSRVGPDAAEGRRPESQGQGQVQDPPTFHAGAHPPMNAGRPGHRSGKRSARVAYHAVVKRLRPLLVLL